MKQLNTSVVFKNSNISHEAQVEDIDGGLKDKGETKSIPTTRLRFAARFLGTDVPFVTRLCALSTRSDCSWPTLLCTDFEWLIKRMPNRFADLGDPSQQFSMWLKTTSYCRRWNNVLRFLSCRRAPCENEVVTKSAHACPYLSLETTLTCDLCSFVICDISVLNSHKHRKHGYKNLARGFVIDNCCLACLRMFHDREKTVKHLAYGAPNACFCCSPFTIPCRKSTWTTLTRLHCLVKLPQ